MQPTSPRPAPSMSTHSQSKEASLLLDAHSQCEDQFLANGLGMLLNGLGMLDGAASFLGFFENMAVMGTAALVTDAFFLGGMLPGFGDAACASSVAAR